MTELGALANRSQPEGFTRDTEGIPPTHKVDSNPNEQTSLKPAPDNIPNVNSTATLQNPPTIHSRHIPIHSSKNNHSRTFDNCGNYSCSCPSCSCPSCSCSGIAGTCGSSLFFIVFFSIWFGVSGTVFGFGISMVIEGIEYANEATTEQCLLISSECNCSGTGDDEECSTCYADKYTFYATVQDKCQDIMLTYKENDCPGTQWDIGTTKKCYVLDCKDKEFSLTHFSSNIVVGAILIAVGGLFICFGCGGAVSFCNGFGPCSSF